MWMVTRRHAETSSTNCKSSESKTKKFPPLYKRSTVLTFLIYSLFPFTDDESTVSFTIKRERWWKKDGEGYNERTILSISGRKQGVSVSRCVPL